CECLDVHPPRKDGESWLASNCTRGTCTNGTVHYTNTTCPPLKPVVCANNFPAIKITDPNDCCPHYECQCICYGWGDPHYVTFDGTYYGFQGNCSYWLMKEIVPKYNFSVMIDNDYCGALDGLSCPESITVFYNGLTIFITQNDINGTFTNQVFVNNKLINPAYGHKDFGVTTTGIDTVLIIPAIQAKITFSGLIFSIYLPYNLFSGNTEGQCGTCDNNRTDDCRLPDGKIDPSCPNMAHQWHTNGTDCGSPPPPPTTPAPDTCNTTLCNVIMSRVFEACHKIIAYKPFVTGCEFDICHMHNNRTGCTSLQAYAEACAEAGVCIEWRNATNGLCGMQLRYTLYNQKFIYTANVFTAMTNMTTEGCYCPNGTILLSSGTNECAGATWTEGCQNCICEEDTLQVFCSPITCSTNSPVACDQEGQFKVYQNESCCLVEKIYFCAEFLTLYIQVGDVVPMKPCEKCICSNQTDASSHLHIVECYSMPCDTHCPLGYEYQNNSGQCCGTCVQTSCIVTLPNNVTQTLKVGVCVCAL
uniref:Mucin 5f n=1 Tax=Acanthochromis polyacanthus TaxID=80966 RepID=A0A3Q1ESC7_9TELE